MPTCLRASGLKYRISNRIGTQAHELKFFSKVLVIPQFGKHLSNTCYVPVAKLGALDEGIQSSHKDQFVHRSFILMEVGNSFTQFKFRSYKRVYTQQRPGSDHECEAGVSSQDILCKYMFTSISSYVFFLLK